MFLGSRGNDSSYQEQLVLIGLSEIHKGTGAESESRCSLKQSRNRSQDKKEHTKISMVTEFERTPMNNYRVASVENAKN